MNRKYVTIFVIFFYYFASNGQTVQDIIDQIDINRLEQTVAELTGEQSAVINGSSQTIVSRVHGVNDLAADYIEEKLLALDNISVEVQEFNTTGKNVIGIQLGQTNPDNIYMICAHYDAVAAFGADDNATGVAAVLEIARVMSSQCTENTIIYALWDEEEVGLRGSDFYATQAADDSNGNTRDNILGVLNMDMIGYDGDAPGTAGDNEFDIDVRDVAGSLAMKDDIVNVLNTYTFDLDVIVVDPGTTFSDHSRFWNQSYSAVLVGESWETNDESPYYHTLDDVLATLDMPYFHEITKLVSAYVATKSVLTGVDNTVTDDGSSLTSNDNNATYQWINCDTDTAITGEINQTFTPSTEGNYAVEVTLGSCTERSTCFFFSVLSTEAFTEAEIKIFPNPVITELQVDNVQSYEIELEMYNVEGKRIHNMASSESIITIDMSDYNTGVYFLKVSSDQKESSYKVVKR